MASVKDLSPHDFMSAVFPQDMLYQHETPVIAYPYTYKKHGVEQTCYRQFPWSPRSGLLNQPQGWVYGISTVRRREERIRRRRQDILRGWVVVCDDVGTKAGEPPVSPSYILETSPGNQQWGYFIDPLNAFHGGCPVKPDADDIDSLMFGLAKAGYNDSGCRGIARMVKLPGAIHKSGFVTRCLHWAPLKAWHIEDLVGEMGVNMDHGAMVRQRAATTKTIDEVDDAVLDWLVAEGMVARYNDSGFAELVECPWGAEHSKGIVTGAGYSPKDYGLEGRGFNCFHASCGRRRLYDFLHWVHQQGGPFPPLDGGDA